MLHFHDIIFLQVLLGCFLTGLNGASSVYSKAPLHGGLTKIFLLIHTFRHPTRLVSLVVQGDDTLSHFLEMNSSIECIVVLVCIVALQCL